MSSLRGQKEAAADPRRGRNRPDEPGLRSRLRRTSATTGLVRSSVAAVCLWASVAAAGSTGAIAWVEDFADDPVVAGRFAVPPGHSADRFTYDAAQQQLTVSYDTFEPTAWYVRPLDSQGDRVLGRYDDFQYTVTFRIRSAGFYADPDGFAQIAWGLINTQTTGEDRAGGSSGPFAFDCLTFDYFPNVSPLWGGPTLGATAIHSDDGQGFFANIDFPYGAESRIDVLRGDETIALDTIYTATVAYSGVDRAATLTISQADQLLQINADGDGGAGGPDGDATTIQTVLYVDHPFAVDAFALTAWQDTYSPYYASVIADVDILRVEFAAPAVPLGDVHVDGVVNGLDIEAFVQLMLAEQPDLELIPRADWNENGILDSNDVEQLMLRLLEP